MKTTIVKQSAVLFAIACVFCSRAFADTFTVTNTNDTGAGSLRQGIADANNHAGTDMISFNIPAPGVQTITPATPLPWITDPVVIEGYTQCFTQPCASPNTNPPGMGDNAVILIEISGAIVGNANGLVIANGGSGSRIRGLAIDRGFDAGIVLIDSSSNVIEGCFIGTDASGLVAHGNFHGVRTDFGGNSSNNLIGGTTSAARNVISGNNRGVFIRPPGTNNRVQGNFIGTDATGTVALSDQPGLLIRSNDNLIGGSTVEARNVIANGGTSFGDGIQLDTADGTSPTGNQIQGNFIGTDVTGTIALGFGIGVDLGQSTSNTQVGGPTTTAGMPPGNVISGNIDSGVVVSFSVGSASNNNIIQGNLIGTDATGTSALGNSNNGIRISGGSIGNLISANGIAFNGFIGIDLNGNGVTMNDHCDGDTGGANNLQNYPVITSASFGAGQVTVSGTLDSNANSGFRLEFFSSPACDPLGFGEGAHFLGSTDKIG